MKTRLIFTLLLVFLCSCGAKKKATGKTVEDYSNASQSESKDSSVIKTIDTTIIVKSDSTLFFITLTPSDRLEKRDTLYLGGMKIPISPIQSISGKNYSNSVEKRGKSDEKQSKAEKKQQAATTNKKETLVVKQEPAADPYRWRYIFFSLLAATALILCIRRIPILNWVKKILSGVKLLK